MQKTDQRAEKKKRVDRLWVGGWVYFLATGGQQDEKISDSSSRLVRRAENEFSQVVAFSALLSWS